MSDNTALIARLRHALDSPDPMSRGEANDLFREAASALQGTVPPREPVAWLYESERSCAGPFTERRVTFTIDRYRTVPTGYRETPLYDTTTPAPAAPPREPNDGELTHEQGIAFDKWWSTSRYAQMDEPKDHWKSIALDTFALGLHHVAPQAAPTLDEQDARRWQWWRRHMKVARDEPGERTCWLEVECIPYRSQTESVDELTDALLARFPLN